MFRLYSLQNQSRHTVSGILVRLAMLCIGVILCMYLIALFPQAFRIKDKLLEATFPVNIAAITLLLCAAVYHIAFKNRNKNFSGTMTLRPDQVILDDAVYPVSQIQRLRFIGNDIRGDFRGFVSKGTENKVILESNGSTVEFGFEQTPEQNLKNQSEILNRYRSAGILSEANLLNILNNTNYY